ncbi:MAG TPA: hypothetical protein VGQ65_00420 [Thermoanaerobaculia bacterium]|jgi:hypothetical protein|nr:hypothetical protein [Thermoanaerobaculia bacterium]
MQWDIRREPRRWSNDEIRSRLKLTPEHFEVFDGEMLFTEEHRVNLLGVVLEQVGIDAALRLAPKELWREALDAYEREQRPFDK